MADPGQYTIKASEHPGRVPAAPERRPARAELLPLCAMSFASLLSLAIGLAMDAAAAAAGCGLSVPRVLPRHVALVAVFFGGSQTLMPLLGWSLGVVVGPQVEAWDHWLAFVLLAAIGAKMLWEARAGAGEPAAQGDRFGFKVLLLLAIATSLDALAVGVTLPMLGAPFALSLATIGVTTALLSVIGLYTGRRFGALLGKRLDAAGGLLLIALGTKILIEHLRA